MYGDPPASTSSPRRGNDPQPSLPFSNGRRPRGQMHNNPPKRPPPQQNNGHYLHSDSKKSNHRAATQRYQSSPPSHSNYYQLRHDPNANVVYHNSAARDRHQTLRRRGSSPRLEDTLLYRQEKVYNNDNGEKVELPPRRNRQKHQHQQPASKSISTTRLSRIVTLIIMCILMLWALFWGVGMGLGLARSAFNMIFSSRRYHRYHQDISYEMEEESESDLGSESEIDIEDSQSQGLRGFSVQFSDAHNTTHDPEAPKGLSIHDLNAKSHELKAKGRQIINDRPMENDEFGKGDKAYMGKDSTEDFFYAGGMKEMARVVNAKGKIEMVEYPAHSYALLPLSLDARHFAISVWVFLTPSVRSGSEKDGTSYEEDRRRPRVILSTRSRDKKGCSSQVFDEWPAAGMVLYAQPHFEDNVKGNNDPKAYRIIFEYALTNNKSCRTLIGSNVKDMLVREGQWHHIVLFATHTSGTDERISLYVNDNLAGRHAQESHRLPSYKMESKTTVGRYTTQDGPEFVPLKNNFDLSGRVGMLSFWETGDRPLLSKVSNQMKIKSESEEDHVVKSLNRAGFDIRAIRELSNQGLTVKAPTLLYTFDKGNQSKATDDLYTEAPRVVNEVILGRNGTIISEHQMKGVPEAKAVDDLTKGIPKHQRTAFVPSGGNRYAEYRDGTYVPPYLKETARSELNKLARMRKGIVKKAVEHVWKGYKKYAYGKDELLPLSNSGQNNWGGMGTTLVDSLSTLWIVGMKDEFYQARDWVRKNLNFDKVEGAVSVFETTIRNLGGLLSAYDLSGDKVFLEKADDLGMRLMRAFESRTGIPYGEVELFDGGRSYNTGWHSNEAVLSEIGTLQVEFRYLAKATGKSEYATDVMRALDELLKLDAENGLYPTFIYNTKQELGFGNSEISIGAMGDSFYEYLLKVWLQGGKREMKYRRMYDKSINGILEKLIHMSRPTYLTYVAELKRDRVIHKMDHLSCFLGGNLALGAYTHPDGLDSVIAQKQLRTGKQLAYTCYQMYARSKSGLSPEFVKFDTPKDDFVKGHAPYYILRPETTETFFILYHLTKDPVYREWGWEIFQAIEEHCKTDAGYAAIRDVDTMQQDNRMESFFLAETLKYLYLLQDDSTEIDLLNTHVFNTEAHPLRRLNLVPGPSQ
eukprot:CAMPEP_0183736060 /NCGR_PEP_ID=MMETSP0737-20130205/48414_1 /TAXON_ID=385413 /ORGANISM="Thalassiosira miniscula, Strain CCMP1093" /LENGTH=1144 /DNA_ID=CAMNT_0025969973 /DNA_START=41 /DNA_END=3475 /DNA_ORIENTATION=-